MPLDQFYTYYIICRVSHTVDVCGYNHSTEIREAAKVEGAMSQLARYIIVTMLKPIIRFVLFYSNGSQGL